MKHNIDEENQTIYSGMWFNGMQDGVGVYIGEDGVKIIGMWRMG